MLIDSCGAVAGPERSDRSYAHSTRLAARSHRIDPSLSGACRTPGPGSRRSARTTTGGSPGKTKSGFTRSEEHTSELQSPCNLVCRLLLEKKKKSESKR